MLHSLIVLLLQILLYYGKLTNQVGNLFIKLKIEN